MRLNALLVCQERKSLTVVEPILDELQIEREICPSASEAMERVVRGQYSAIVLDFDLHGAAQVAKMARVAESGKRSILFALIGTSPAANTSQAGANVMLYKPLDCDQVRCSLRAGRELMRADRRQNSRHKIETLVYLQFGIAAMPALVLDVSEQGISLQAAEPLPRVREVGLRFVIPGTTHHIEAVGEVIWSDESGRAGLFFSQMKINSRKQLNNWLLKHGAKKRDAVRVLMPPERARKLARLSH
jgi:ActR/RegA family two-component response regulator